MIAAHPRRFGRRFVHRPAGAAAAAAAAPLSDELRLFATSYAAGFLFVAVLIF